jgi:hypothetical protein
MVCKNTTFFWTIKICFPPSEISIQMSATFFCSNDTSDNPSIASFQTAIKAKKSIQNTLLIHYYFVPLHHNLARRKYYPKTPFATH